MKRKPNKKSQKNGDISGLNLLFLKVQKNDNIKNKEKEIKEVDTKEKDKIYL